MGTTHRPVEETLQELVRKKGAGYLREGKFFVNAVREMGGEEEGCTLLEYLVAVNGHMDLLNAMEQSPASQKAIYTRTVQKLHSKKLIPEELAHKACASFWRGASRQEPPVKWEAPRQEPPVKREAPRQEPPVKREASPPASVPTAPAPAGQQPAARELCDKEKKILPLWLRIKKVLKVLKVLSGAAGVVAGLSDLMEEFGLTNLFFPAVCGGMAYSSITGKWRTEKMSSILMDIFMIVMGVASFLAGLILLKEFGASESIIFVFLWLGLELLEMAGDDFVKRAIGQGR